MRTVHPLQISEPKLLAESNGVKTCKRILHSLQVSVLKLFGARAALTTASVACNGLNATFNFRAVGFARDTLVRVRDLFAQVDLGVFTEQYTVEVPLHGAQMLHLAYEPKYRTNHTEL